jgi:hypothetical protein
VAASRGRERVDVITSDKERLRDTVAQSTARRSASELARRAQPGLQRGPLRGLAAAMVLMCRAAKFVSAVPKRVLRQAPGKERIRHEHGLSR